MKTGLDTCISVIDADQALQLFRDGRVSMWWIAREPIDQLEIETNTGENLTVYYPPIELVREFAGVIVWDHLLADLEKLEKPQTVTIGEPSLIEKVIVWGVVLALVACVMMVFWEFMYVI